MKFDNNLIDRVVFLINLAKKNNSIITTAESCTGGLVASLLTSIPGASSIFDSGFITYSNKAKNKILGIENKKLDYFGAVSEEVALDMAIKAIEKSADANLSIAITGIAGPNSDNSNKKVGLVFISSLNKKNSKSVVKKFEFLGNREEIRNLSVKNAILTLIEQLENE